MDIIVKKQYSLRNQPYYRLLGLTVGLVDSDLQNLSFYSQSLQKANLKVWSVKDLAELASVINQDPIDAVVFNPNIQRLDDELRSLRGFILKNPYLPVITMAQTMQEMQIDAIMKLGARLHINRDLSHPRDLLVALEQILTN